MHRATSIKITELNPHLICALCGGYYIDAATIIECLHSFCRTCIVGYLQNNKYCPICDVMVHKTKPLEHVKSDKTLQDLVYKLVPGLYKKKYTRGLSEDRGNEDQDRLIYTSDEKISVSLELYSEYMDDEALEPDTGQDSSPGGLKKRDTRFLLCPAAFTIGHLKKFVRLKFDLPNKYNIDVFHSEEPLDDLFTLMDIAYIYTWRRSSPLRLIYTIYEVPQYRKRRPTEANKCIKETQLDTDKAKNCKQLQNDTPSTDPKDESSTEDKSVSETPMETETVTPQQTLDLSNKTISAETKENSKVEIANKENTENTGEILRSETSTSPLLTDNKKEVLAQKSVSAEPQIPPKDINPEVPTPPMHTQDKSVLPSPCHTSCNGVEPVKTVQACDSSSKEHVEDNTVEKIINKQTVEAEDKTNGAEDETNGSVNGGSSESVNESTDSGTTVVKQDQHENTHSVYDFQDRDSSPVGWSNNGYRSYSNKTKTVLNVPNGRMMTPNNSYHDIGRIPSINDNIHGSESRTPTSSFHGYSHTLTMPSPSFRDGQVISSNVRFGKKTTPSKNKTYKHSPKHKDSYKMNELLKVKDSQQKTNDPPKVKESIKAKSSSKVSVAKESSKLKDSPKAKGIKRTYSSTQLKQKTVEISPPTRIGLLTGKAFVESPSATIKKLKKKDASIQDVLESLTKAKMKETGSDVFDTSGRVKSSKFNGLFTPHVLNGYPS